MEFRVHDLQSYPQAAGAVLSAAVLLLLASLSMSASCAQAQGTTAQTASTQAVTSLDGPRPVPAKPVTPAKPATAKSSWKDLTPTQQQALKPLAEHWASLGVERRRKWLEISKNYPSWSPTEQAKLHSRMREWVLLSQQQRDQARLNFAETKNLSPKEKAAEWEAYQSLSPEAKKKLALAAKPASRPAGVAVIKSPTPAKLANVPVTPHTSIQGARLAAAKQPVQQNTLLPQPADTSEPEQASTVPSE
jgi:Protein of unknown function (DUF3106)